MLEKHFPARFCLSNNLPHLLLWKNKWWGDNIWVQIYFCKCTFSCPSDKTSMRTTNARLTKRFIFFKHLICCCCCDPSRSYPYNIGYDVNLEGVLLDCHCIVMSVCGWTCRNRDNETEWIWGGMRRGTSSTSVHISYFALLQLSAVKAFGRGPFFMAS